MKTLFFLVVIANVALFMWEYKTGALAPVIETTSQNTDLNQEQILLLSELKNIPQPILPAPASEPPVEETALIEKIDAVSPSVSESVDKSAPKDPIITTADKIENHCYEVGPFINNKLYLTWASRLKDIESNIKQLSRKEPIASSYIVYYQTAETAAQTETDIQMLKNHGVKDFWLVTTGEDKDKISLGVFSKETSALAMKSELLAKGINAEIKPRYKTKARKYALIKGDGKLTERLGVLKQTYPQLSVKQISDTTQGCW
jgi:hypothetical protein